MRLTWVHSSRTICSCGSWWSELKMMNSLKALAISARTFVFQRVGSSCREQHHLFLQDVEMPRKLGNKKSFWKIVTLWDCLEWTMSQSSKPSDSKMWYTDIPLLSDEKMAFGNNPSPFFWVREGLLEAFLTLEVTWLWLDTQCCLLRTNTPPHPPKKEKASYIMWKKISGFIQLEKGKVLNFEFPRLMLFILRMPCFCHRSSVQHPLSQHLICIQSFSLLFLQSSL